MQAAGEADPEAHRGGAPAGHTHAADHGSAIAATHLRLLAGAAMLLLSNVMSSQQVLNVVCVFHWVVHFKV